jgi:hypothetical protein
LPARNTGSGVAPHAERVTREMCQLVQLELVDDRSSIPVKGGLPASDTGSTIAPPASGKNKVVSNCGFCKWQKQSSQQLRLLNADR